MADFPTSRSVFNDIRSDNLKVRQTSIVPQVNLSKTVAVPDAKLAFDTQTKSLYFSSDREWHQLSQLGSGDCCCISIRWAVGQDWSADVYPHVNALAGYPYGTLTGTFRNVVVFVDPDTTPRLLNGSGNNLNNICFVGSDPTQRSHILFDPVESPNNIDTSPGYVRLYGKNVIFESQARTFSGVAARVDLDDSELRSNPGDFYRTGQTNNFWCLKNNSLVSTSTGSLNSVCTLSIGSRLMIFASTGSKLGPLVASSGAATNLDIYHDSTVTLVAPLTDGGTPPVTQIILVGDAPRNVEADGCCCDRD